MTEARLTGRVRSGWVGSGGICTAVGFVALLLLTAAGCDPQGQRARSEPSPTPVASAPTATASQVACRASYAAPDPLRPVIRLAFELTADRRTVTGTQQVRFTPDLPVTELVFRLWPNANGVGAPAGASLTVTRASVAGAGPFTTESVSGKIGTQGTLLAIPLGRTAPVGVALSADLTFTLRLPSPHFERWGSSGSTAWWGSGYPLLAWERQRGWQRQPAVRFPSEAAVSEAAATDLTVTVPAGDTVLMTGRVDPPKTVAGGRRQWHATSTVARDVSVSVGRFSTRAATIEGVAVVVGVSSELRNDPDELLAQTRRSIQRLAKLYGPFPYPSLSVAALPGLSSGGIEFPGAIMVGPRDWTVVVPHEVAHEYFYGMIGDNQARDPWLDEAFATYSEALVNDAQARYLPELDRPGPVGSTMQSWGADRDGYYATVYGKGGAALLTARQRVGAAAFDAALRCYVNDNAWTVATPDDVVRALTHLPAALAVLRDAHALP